MVLDEVPSLRAEAGRREYTKKIDDLASVGGDQWGVDVAVGIAEGSLSGILQQNPSDADRTLSSISHQWRLGIEPVTDVAATLARGPAPTGLVATPSSYAADDLACSVHDLPPISNRTANVLCGAKIFSLGALLQHRAEDLQALQGLGPKAIEDIRDALAAKGIDWA